jgi:hypothetical protein
LSTGDRFCFIFIDDTFFTKVMHVNDLKSSRFIKLVQSGSLNIKRIQPKCVSSSIFAQEFIEFELLEHPCSIAIDVISFFRRNELL